MIISFGWTAQYLPPNGPKDTTRRLWEPGYLASWQKAWDVRPEYLHRAVNKSLQYGGKDIGHIRLIERPYLQSLREMPYEDLQREGGMAKSVAEFIDRYFKGDSSQIVAVVRFKFIPLGGLQDVSPVEGHLLPPFMGVRL